MVIQSMRLRPTIGDVARLAGVSTATVSRSLHQPDVVTETTRERVLEAVRSTGYTQNTAAQNLRRNRANAILVLVPDIGNTFFSHILAGIEREASAAGLTMLIGNTGHDPAREEDFMAYLVNGRADGALVLTGRLPFLEGTGGHDTLQNLPIVTISERIGAAGFPHVGIDNVAAAAAATRHLIELGHRRIAHLAGPMTNILTTQRLAGYQDALRESGIGARPDDLLIGDFTLESGVEAGKRILAMDDPPGAIFCSNDEMALGLISALHESDHRVPERMSVVGFDDISFARNSIPPLTTVHQPRNRIGERAMQVLLDTIEGITPKPPQSELLSAELIVRGSTRPAGGAD